jgi:hypothetical protein
MKHGEQGTRKADGEFHKTSFDTTCFNMLVTLQDQMEKMVNSFVDQTRGFPRGEKGIFQSGKHLQEGARRLQEGCG